MPSEISIRPELRPAFEIFVRELQSHVEYFQKLLVRLDQQVAHKESANDILASERTSLEHRFHTIRGGAGFLGFETMQTLAEQGEKMFRSGQPLLGIEKETKCREIVVALEREVEQVNRFQSTLSSSEKIVI